MHKLNAAEAERVRTVLSGGISRVDALALLPVHYESSVEDRLVEEKTAEEVKETLLGQFQLEEAYAHALGPEKPILFDRVRGGVVTLCRSLEEHPQGLQVLREVGLVKPAEARGLKELSRGLAELAEVAFEQVSRTLEEAESKRKLLGEFTRREQEASEERTTLETELDLVRREKERTLSTLGVQLAKLETELTDVAGHKTSEEAHVQRLMADKLAKLHGKHEEVREELLGKIKKLEEEIEQVVVENEEREISQRKKVSKSETETNRWIETYDTDMTKKYLKLKRIEARIEAEDKRMDELSIHFAQVDQENERIQQEEAKWQEYIAERYEEERIYDDGAAALQKLYRGAAARVEVAALKKKSKKKSKGKKG